MPVQEIQRSADAALLLDSQLCFPLYACAREVVKRYRPFLDELGLTYTQYITMMVLWETPCVSSRQLGRRLFLDSGTLTPVLKKLESMGYVNRNRDERDERNLIVTLTEEGAALKKRAAIVPQQMASCIRIEPGDAFQLYTLLHRLLDTMREKEDPAAILAANSGRRRTDQVRLRPVFILRKQCYVKQIMKRKICKRN